jgi:hypothetical protein
VSLFWRVVARPRAAADGAGQGRRGPGGPGGHRNRGTPPWPGEPQLDILERAHVRSVVGRLPRACNLSFSGLRCVLVARRAALWRAAHSMRTMQPASLSRLSPNLVITVSLSQVVSAAYGTPVQTGVTGVSQA